MGQYRDVSFLDWSSADDLVLISCDSSAAIGLKSGDAFACPPEITAAMALRVPLMEALAIRAEPKCVVFLAGNEMQPTAARALEGIKQELLKAGLDKLDLNGSTEENMLTSMTSIGITLLSKGRDQDLLWKQCRPGHKVFQLGQAWVGPDVLAHLDDLIDYQTIHRLSLTEGVKEIVPIGSKGALNEAHQLAGANGLDFELDPGLENNHQLQASAGPATAFLIACREDVSLEDFLDKAPWPLTYLGRLVQGHA